MFDDPSPDNMIESISNRKDGTSLLPLNHPVVHQWNLAHATDGLAKTEKDIIPTLAPDIQMKTSDIDHFLPIAKKAVSSNISLANVTSDIALVVSPIQPFELQRYNQRATEEGKPTRPFTGFADPGVVLGPNYTAEQKNAHQGTRYTLYINATAKYVKLDANAEL